MKITTLIAALCLSLTTAMAQEFTVNNVPEQYVSTETEQGGQVVRLDYLTTNWQTGAPMSKHAEVYLPYGYTAARKYNVFYLMHGGGTSEEEYLVGSEKEHTLYNGDGFSSTKLKRILDHSIADGRLEPLIVVCPTFYLNAAEAGDKGNAGDCTKNFSAELQNSVIPAVERAFSTHTGRDHRAFGGFSMGSVTTWYQLCQSLDYFRYFMPMSGDCWGVTQLGGAHAPAETAAYIQDAINRSGRSADEFNIISMTGSKDIAHDHLGAQIGEMRKLPLFRFSADMKGGNIRYGVYEGGEHNYDYMIIYIYNALPLFFK